MSKNHYSTLFRSVAIAGVLASGVTACGSGGSNSGPDSGEEFSSEDIQAALSEGGDITVWAWEPTLEPSVEEFEKEYPNVNVELVNVGSGTDHFTALQNAIAAGSGVPDVAQMPYYSIPQFVISESLTDLNMFGAGQLEDEFAPGTWTQVQYREGIYGLPMDSGPLALFYNKTLFDTHGIEVPTTWDQYIDAARKFKEADPNIYIINDPSSPDQVMSKIWQAGGRPFAAEGNEVAIDFSDEGTKRYTSMWQPLIDEELIVPMSDYTDEWYQALGNGNIATLVTAAWLPPSLISGLPGSAGDWRVAPLPQYEEDEFVTSELGGSSLAIPEASENKALAFAFMEYSNIGEGAQIRVDNGTFPAKASILQSEEFLNKEFEYFGGQQANKIFAESSQNVPEGWTYLPFQVYAGDIFNNYVGDVFTTSTTLQDALVNWDEGLTDYAREQGFTMAE